jgi:hypothetical protein
MIESDLRRFKQLMESGDINSAGGQAPGDGNFRTL